MNPALLKAAGERRKAMLADLRRVVKLCVCEWPITVYRNGDGHHHECPVHQAYEPAPNGRPS